MDDNYADLFLKLEIEHGETVMQTAVYLASILTDISLEEAVKLALNWNIELTPEENQIALLNKRDRRLYIFGDGTPVTKDEIENRIKLK